MKSLQRAKVRVFTMYRSTRYGTLIRAFKRGVANMSIHTRAHYEAMKDLIELMAIASALALIADAFWIVRDMVADGVTYGRLFVMVFLDLALAIQLYALVRFHKILAADIKNVLKAEKLKICKAKYKRSK